jgi:hypothetical protein
MTAPVWDVRDLATVFESVDWIVPPYIQIGVLRKLAVRINAAPDTQKHKILEDELASLYGPNDTAVMLLERYEKTPHVADFKVAIAEAIEAAHLGLFNTAVCTLIPVIEGVIRKLASARGQSVGDGTQKMVDEIDELINQQASSGAAAIERVAMLEAFRDFLKKKLLERTSRYAGTGELNRHGILHGVFSAFGYDWNFYKVLSFLDLLCFFIALTTDISQLAPDRTRASEVLARYYRHLVDLRATAVAAGARPTSCSRSA